jgi:hypothetical protein
MKKILSLSAAATLFGILFLTSCAKNEEPEPTTPTSSDPRARFHGNWAVSEDSKDYGPSTYNLTIADSSNSTHILFSYLYGFNKKTYATVSGNNIIIPVQVIQGNNVSGSGALTNANRIDLSYLVQTTGTHYDTVKYVLTK